MNEGLKTIRSDMTSLMTRCLLEPETRMFHLMFNSTDEHQGISGVGAPKYIRLSSHSGLLNVLRDLLNEMNRRFESLDINTVSLENLFPAYIVLIDEIDFVRSNEFIESLGDNPDGVSHQQEIVYIVEKLADEGEVLGIHVFATAKGAKRRFGLPGL